MIDMQESRFSPVRWFDPNGVRKRWRMSKCGFWSTVSNERFSSTGLRIRVLEYGFWSMGSRNWIAINRIEATLTYQLKNKNVNDHLKMHLGWSSPWPWHFWAFLQIFLSLFILDDSKVRWSTLAHEAKWQIWLIWRVESIIGEKLFSTQYANWWPPTRKLSPRKFTRTRW